MSDHPTSNDVREMFVHDFFCPKATRSCSPVAGKQIYDLCFAANITTIGQLVTMTDAQLRARSFSDDDLKELNAKLGSLRENASGLSGTLFAAAAAAGRAVSRGHLELTPQQRSVYLEHNGAGHLSSFVGRKFNYDQ